MPTIAVPTVDAGQRADACKTIVGITYRGTWKDSAAGQALATVLDAVRAGETSADVSLPGRRDASSFVRVCDAAACEDRAAGAPATVLRAVAAAVVAADTAAHPDALALRNL